MPKSQEEADRNRMKRIVVNDPVALRIVGGTRRDKEGDYKSAFVYLSKAAELGDVDAHYGLSIMYEAGQGVEKDEKKKLHHLEWLPLARTSQCETQSWSDRVEKWHAR
jgi:hypothetical protein